MTLALIPSSSSTSSFGEQTAVDDWAMRRIDKGSIPASSLRGMGEQTAVDDWAMRRLAKGSIPRSSLNGSWPVNQLAAPFAPLPRGGVMPRPSAYQSNTMRVRLQVEAEKSRLLMLRIPGVPGRMISSALSPENYRNTIADAARNATGTMFWRQAISVVALLELAVERYPDSAWLRGNARMLFEAIAGDSGTRTRQILQGLMSGGAPQEGNVAGLGAHWPVNPLAEQTAVDDWAMRRIDKGSIPASSLAEMLGAGWPVNPLAETTAVDDWAMRRIDKGSIPASSLRGLGRATYDYTGLGRAWPVNPLAETTFVGDQERRRYGKHFTPASQADLMGFGALDGNVSVRTAQEAMRKLGVCVVLDGDFGPETDGGFRALAGRSQLVPTGTGPFWAGTTGANEVRVDMAWWARITAAASGMVDNCSAGGGGGGGGDSGDSGGDSGGSDPDAGGGYAPPEDSWMATLSSPWVLLGIAAALGAGYWYYNQGESDAGGDDLYLPEL